MSNNTGDDLPARLRAGGSEREAAAQELRDLLVRAALAYLARQAYPAAAFGADSYEAVAEDVAHDALARILRQLDAFRGESRFTTWCYRIAVNLLADEIRRRTWRHRPLDGASVAEGEEVAPLWRTPWRRWPSGRSSGPSWRRSSVRS